MINVNNWRNMSIIICMDGPTRLKLLPPALIMTIGHFHCMVVQQSDRVFIQWSTFDRVNIYYFDNLAGCAYSNLLI